MVDTFKTENIQVLTAIAEKFYHAKDMSTTSIRDLASDMCIGISNVRAAILMLAERKFLIRHGARNKALESRWKLNPDYPGTLADAISGKKGAFKNIVPPREYPKDFKVAGPAYHSPPCKEDWSNQYAQQLNSFRKVAEMARK